MKDLIKIILAIIFIVIALNVIYTVGDWICKVLPPFAIYLIIVGGFSATTYYIYKKEVE